MLRVDPGGDSFVVAYGQEKHANNAVLQQRSVTFQTSKGQWRLEFTVGEPAETLLDGVAAVRFPLPPALFQSHRREHPRFKVPPALSLRCIADASGVAPFEARIVDLSRGGMGTMIYDPSVRLSPGTVLRGSKIMIPAAEAAVVDLEVRYTISVVLPDGAFAHRSGVRFIGRPERIEALLRLFVVELGPERGAP